MREPLAVDLFCGLGGWTEGLLAERYFVVGFDIERHEYGDQRYPAQLVIQDVLTLHGSQFKDAALIVASPPCQEYSYMAMPWSRARAKAAAIRADTSGAEIERLNRLFNACFRIQREASEAAGLHVPMVVENVKGAIPWVGRSRWNFGSYHLWGDTPALMPATSKGVKGKPYEIGNKNDGGSWFAIAHNTASGHSQNPDGRKGIGPKGGAHGMTRWTNPAEGRKGAGAGAEWFDQNLCQLSSKSPSRKAASAMIAKIPFPLSRHVAATFRPH